MDLRKTSYSIIFGLAIAAILTTGCKEDEAPLTGKIFGTITIDSVELWETWQDSGELQLTIFPEFSLDPPAGWGEVPDEFFGPNVPGGTFAIGAPVNAQNPIVLEYEPGVNQFNFEIELDPGTYSALALGFRHDFINDANTRTATLGVHWSTPASVSHGVVIYPFIGGPAIFDEPAPSTFTIAAGDQVDFSFKADFSFVSRWYN